MLPLVSFSILPYFYFFSSLSSRLLCWHVSCCCWLSIIFVTLFSLHRVCLSSSCWFLNIYFHSLVSFHVLVGSTICVSVHLSFSLHMHISLVLSQPQLFLLTHFRSQFICFSQLHMHINLCFSITVRKSCKFPYSRKYFQPDVKCRGGGGCQILLFVFLTHVFHKKYIFLKQSQLTS